MLAYPVVSPTTDWCAMSMESKMTPMTGLKTGPHATVQRSGGSVHTVHHYKLSPGSKYSKAYEACALTRSPGSRGTLSCRWWCRLRSWGSRLPAEVQAWSAPLCRSIVERREAAQPGSPPCRDHVNGSGNGWG